MKDHRIYEYDTLMESDKWIKQIPYIKFPKDYEVQISPPFAGAVVRFRVKKRNAEVSIYLDCYDNLGFYGKPYWEVYPIDDDVYRCDMDDIEALLKAIKSSIRQQII